VFSFFALHAQYAVSGKVYENKTRIALNNIRVINITTHQNTVTAADGQFTVAGRVGDIIVFKGYSYLPDTLLLTDLKDKEVFLQPESTMLKQVTITDSSGRTGQAAKNMQYVDPQFHGQTIVYHRDLKENFDGGIIIRMHYFKKDERDKERAAQKAADRATIEEIQKVFTPENIGKYVPLKGEDMQDFILLYIPDVKTYKSKDFNLATWLNDCYKEWLTLTPDQKREGRIFKN
jgi:hypothetical protein